MGNPTFAKPDNLLFHPLNEEEEKVFKVWARTNYKINTEINGTWHPIVQLECVKMNAGIDEHQEKQYV